MGLRSHASLVAWARKDVGMRMTSSDRNANYARVFAACSALAEAPRSRQGLLAMKCDELRSVCRAARLVGFSRMTKDALVSTIERARAAIEAFASS